MEKGKGKGKEMRAENSPNAKAIPISSYQTWRNPSRGASPDNITTSFLIANLHCPTCVTALRRVLHEACENHVRWVSPNIVTSVVTVDHDQNAHIDTMAAALQDAGFEVSGATTTADDSGRLGRLTHEPSIPNLDGEAGAGSARNITRSDPAGSSLPGWINGSRLGRRIFEGHSSQNQAHLANCEQCQAQSNEKEGTVDSPEPRVSSIRGGGSDDLPESATSPTGTTPIVGTPPQVMSSKSLVIIDTVDDVQEIWKASVAVGGMTCAVCVNAITDELNKIDWITKVTVNLISNSATVEFKDRSKADQIAEAIEDLGYEATTDSITRVEAAKAVRAVQRTVEIAIQGMYCDHCPGKIANSLESFQDSLEIVNPPTRQRPIATITYTPKAPTFTIRHILSAIENGDEELKASIFHPPTLEERSRQMQRKHQHQVALRVLFAAIVAIPTFIIGIVYMSFVPDHNPFKHDLMKPWVSGISRAQVALFGMATPVYFFGADVFHVRAFKEIRTLWRRGSRTPFLQRFYRFGSMNTLMSLGTTIAYVSSVSQMIAAAVYRPHEVADSNFYFDSVVFLTLFLLLGRLIEAYSKAKTGEAVESLVKLRPTTAILVDRPGQQGQDDNSTGASIDTVIQADLLDFGDIVRVPHGASPPADGIIVQGETSFDESSLTGESRPIRKHVDDEVFAGTVNKDGAVLVRVTGTSGTSMLDQIVAVVREGQTKRAPMERIADRLTMYFVPVVTLVAILTWIIWLAIGSSGHLPGHWLDVTSGGWVAFSLQFAIAVFVVACPCGLGLAAPTAIFVGGGIAAKCGILAKGGGEAFEKASKIACVVFDKTGTLTVGGEPTITDALLYPGTHVDSEKEEIDEVRDAELLAALKAVEENSSHPIAKAIVAFCATKRVAGMGYVDSLQEIPGKGMKAVYTSPTTSFEILVGNEALLADFAVPVSSALASTLEGWKLEAKSVALAATRALAPVQIKDGTEAPALWTLAAALSISDEIRPEAKSVIATLHSLGIQTYMLSGDNPTTALAVASRLAIPPDHVIAGVLPNGKADQIKRIQATVHATLNLPNGKTVDPNKITRQRSMIAMVGDGINDAPALTQADVGIAIGTGSDVAISHADFVLVTARLSGVVTLLQLSRAVFRRIGFNFGWALVYNVIAIPVAAGVFYPIKDGRGTHVRLDPVWASLAMALSSVSVVTSSLLLRSRVPVLGFRVKKEEVR